MDWNVLISIEFTIVFNLIYDPGHGGRSASSNLSLLLAFCPLRVFNVLYLYITCVLRT